MDIMAPFNNFKIPSKELLKPGQRVRVVCVKEMVYLGNSCDNSSDWQYDGNGDHAIVFCEPIQE